MARFVKVFDKKHYIFVILSPSLIHEFRGKGVEECELAVSDKTWTRDLWLTVIHASTLPTLTTQAYDHAVSHILPFGLFQFYIYTEMSPSQLHTEIAGFNCPPGLNWAG